MIIYSGFPPKAVVMNRHTETTRVPSRITTNAYGGTSGRIETPQLLKEEAGFLLTKAFDANKDGFPGIILELFRKYSAGSLGHVSL